MKHPLVKNYKDKEERDHKNGVGVIDRVKRGFYWSIVLTAIFSALMFVCAQLFGISMVRLFVKDHEVIQFGAKALAITSCFYFPLGLIYVSRSLLNGAGDALASMINGCMEVIGRIVFPMILINIMGVGVWGIWYTTGFTWSITGIAGMRRYAQGKWKHKALV